MFVLSHPGLSSPLLLSDDQAKSVLSSVQSGAANVVLGTTIVPTSGMTMEEHRQFLNGDYDRLQARHQYRCGYGRVHENADTGSHENCAEKMDLSSPYVDPTVVERMEVRRVERTATEHPELPPQELALTLDQAFSRSETTVRPETIVKTTLKVLGNGHNVFRTLVRMHRRNANLIPVEYRTTCAQYDSLPIDKVPLAPPIQFPKVSPTPISV